MRFSLYFSHILSFLFSKLYRDCWGSTNIEPSGKIIVGIIRLPPLTCSTNLHPCLHCSISHHVNEIRHSVSYCLARSVSGHQVVPYILMFGFTIKKLSE
jgi:hypothetical protein